jgi:hypothetical protein
MASKTIRGKLALASLVRLPLAREMGTGRQLGFFIGF